jgi:hypothetical protein
MSASAWPNLPVFGESAEVVRHHVGQHPCEADCIVIRCPCDITRVIVCTGCREPIFFAVRPWVWCEHAQAMWQERVA